MLCKRTLTLIASLFLLNALAATTRADELAAKGREVFAKYQHAIVTVQTVLKVSAQSGRSNESRRELTGTVLDPSGLTVLALSACDPTEMYRRMSEDPKVEIEVSDIKLLLDDGTELPAQVVLRDKDLDLAFVRPTTKPAQPMACVDLLFADPPYNMNKPFNGTSFTEMELADYERWLDSWIGTLVPRLKADASVYVCGDWRSSTAIHRVLQRHFVVRNRITWEREKGRGALANWKNASEDIWYCTKSNEYKFFVDRVKLKRRVITARYDGVIDALYADEATSRGE